MRILNCTDLLSSFAVTVLLVLPSVGQDDLKLGDNAPSLPATVALRGAPLSEFQSGRCYVIDFIGTSCIPCITSLPEMHRLADEHHDAEFASVFSEPDEEKIAEFIERYSDDLPNRIVQDAERELWDRLATDSGFIGIPLVVVVDVKGRIAWIGRPAELGKSLETIVRGSHVYENDGVGLATKVLQKKLTKNQQRRSAMQKEAWRINQIVGEVPDDKDFIKTMKMLDDAIEEYSGLEICDALRKQRVYISGRIPNGRARAYTLAVDLCVKFLEKEMNPCSSLIGQYDFAIPENKDQRILDLAQGYLQVSENQTADVYDAFVRQYLRAEIALHKNQVASATRLIDSAIVAVEKYLADPSNQNDDRYKHSQSLLKRMRVSREEYSGLSKE